MPMPGMIFINSPASRPTIERSSIMFLLNVWLACGESTGTTDPANDTTSTCACVLATCSVIVPRPIFAPWDRVMAPCS